MSRGAFPHLRVQGDKVCREVKGEMGMRTLQGIYSWSLVGEIYKRQGLGGVKIMVGKGKGRMCAAGRPWRKTPWSKTTSVEKRDPGGD